MFTGIIEERGRVEAVVPTAEGARVRIGSTRVIENARIGDSVAVNGVCLTVAEHFEGGFIADAIPETLNKSNLGRLTSGDAVNLERPLAAGGRFDGHIVQGHVDGVGEVAFSGVRDGEGHRLTIRVPDELRRYTIAKGSITIDGVSLTIAELTEDGVEVALIPLTLELTALGDRQAGDRVNLEVDMVAKYIERMMEAYQP